MLLRTTNKFIRKVTYETHDVRKHFTISLRAMYQGNANCPIYNDRTTNIKDFFCYLKSCRF